MLFTGINCGQEIDPEFDNAFPIGGDAFICMQCDEQEQIDLINDRLAERVAEQPPAADIHRGETNE